MKLAPLLLGLLLTGCSCTKHETSIFGEPLFVNGRRVTDDEIKLALIYGPGRILLDVRKIDLLVQNEIARQARERAQGDAAAEARISKELQANCSVSDEDLEAEVKYTVDDFKKDYPTLDIGAEMCRAFRSVDWYREQLRETMTFDRVFLPEDPANWPTTTIAAFEADPDSRGLLLPDARQSYAARLAKADPDSGKLPREDPLYLTFQRQIVRESLEKAIAFKTHADGIDPKLALWADSNGDGKPELTVTIEELWYRIQETVTEVEIEAAKQWYVTSLATQRRLDKDGALLGEQEREAALAEHESSRGKDDPTLKQEALEILYFPSLESYREYYALRKGFEQLIATKIADGPNGELSPTLTDYLPRANQAMGLGMVESEVLLVSALDVGRFRWKKDGWFQARRKAQSLREEYDKDPTPESWSRLMDRHSEYWDPPAPEPHDGKRQAHSDVGYKKKGRFGPHYRNDLIGYVGESAYSEWVTGECITDRIFFDQEPNTTAGPFRGPLGWYLTRVKGRTPPVRTLELDMPRQRQRLKDDYVRWAFIQYSKEAVAQAQVRGWKPL